MSWIALIISTLINYSSSVQYSRNLTVHHSEHSGIAISINPEHVSTDNNRWHINPSNQNSYDLQLLLSHQWTFHPSMESQLTLSLNGYTPETSKSDCEFIIVFSVDNTEYFAVVIRLDTQRNTWKYYPQITGSSSDFIINDNIDQNIISGGRNFPNRWNRISNSNETIDNWKDIQPYTKAPLEWPLNIKLINNPITNTLLYECDIPNLRDGPLSIEYLRAFSSHKQIKIYILNDADDNKPFDIHWIYVQYNDNSAANITTTQTITTNVPTTSNSTTLRPSSEGIHKEELPEPYPSIQNEGIEVGAMIGIVIAVVVVTVCIVVLIFLYWKKKESDNDPQSLNRSEYHTPKVDTSNTDISQVLEKKRRESEQFAAENNLLKKMKNKNTNKSNENGLDRERTQSIVPIDDSVSDDDFYTTDTNTENDSKFNED